jgi:hypothetical protein
MMIGQEVRPFENDSDLTQMTGKGACLMPIQDRVVAEIEG